MSSRSHRTGCPCRCLTSLNGKLCREYNMSSPAPQVDGTSRIKVQTEQWQALDAWVVVIRYTYYTFGAGDRKLWQGNWSSSVCGPSASRCGMACKNYGLLQIRTANTAVPNRLDSQCTIKLSTTLYYSSSVSMDYSRIVAKH